MKPANAAYLHAFTKRYYLLTYRHALASSIQSGLLKKTHMNYTKVIEVTQTMEHLLLYMYIGGFSNIIKRSPHSNKLM